MNEQDFLVYSAGKWQIVTKNRTYYANLIDNLGEILLTTPTYTALSGVKSGIETIKQNIERNNFAISVDKSGKYFFKLYSSSTRLLCLSDVYPNLEKCKKAIEKTIKFAKTELIKQ